MGMLTACAAGEPYGVQGAGCGQLPADVGGVRQSGAVSAGGARAATACARAAQHGRTTGLEARADVQVDGATGWDRATVTAWAQAAVGALAAAQRRIDAVNVFPVADGDTGTNVQLTIAGGAHRAWEEPSDAGAGSTLAALADGALLAARGNSGVIVSQYLAGLAQPLRHLRVVTQPSQVAAGLRAAADAARRAVHLPEEGTVVTLAEAIADAADHAAPRHDSPGALLAEAVGVGHAELARICATHPVLRAAGVPDAGACALLVLLDELVRVTGAVAGSRRDGLPLPVAAGSGAGDDDAWVGTEWDRTDQAGVDWPGLEWLPEVTAGDVRGTTVPDGVFEVMAVVRTADRAWGETAADLLAPFGDSIAVVGSEGVWQVHVHTVDAVRVLAVLDEGGAVREQAVVRLVETPQPSVPADERRFGVVACVASVRIAQELALLRAVVVVAPEAGAGGADGGAEPESSLVRDVARAVDDAATTADAVVVLAGDRWSAAAARRADRSAVADVVELDGDAQVSDAAVLLLAGGTVGLADVRRLAPAKEEER